MSGDDKPFNDQTRREDPTGEENPSVATGGKAVCNQRDASTQHDVAPSTRREEGLRRQLAEQQEAGGSSGPQDSSNGRNRGQSQRDIATTTTNCGPHSTISIPSKGHIRY